MKISVPRMGSYSRSMIEVVHDRLATVPRHHRAYVSDILSAAQKEQELTDTLNNYHELQRLYWVASVDGLNSATLTELKRNKMTWKDYQTLPLSKQQFSNLADKMYHANAPEKAPLIILSDYTRGYGEALVDTAIKNIGHVGVHVRDSWALSLALSQCKTEEKAHNLARAFREPWSVLDRRLTLKSEYNSFSRDLFQVDKSINKIFLEESSRLEKENKHKPYTLTSMPCPQHAMLDGVSHVVLCDYYYNMSRDDDKVITPVHDAMTDFLNNGSRIVIQNDHGTYLDMSIAGQNFLSSKTVRNIPGSEVYGSPELYSVNGIIQSPERYVYKGQMIEGVFMELRDGVVVSYKAEKGHDALTDIMEIDYKNGFAQKSGTPASKGIGELGFGTALNGPNWQSSLNIMGEKRIGVHVATGRAYTDTFYGASADNGNRGSTVHKDWTLNMIDTNGSIIVDGIPMMDKGQYVLPGTEILNRPRKDLSL